jgi:predicted nucleic-acid-binding Zn-ribbon protein
MTLKRDLKCPNCDGHEIWRIETMNEHGPGGVRPLGVVLERTFLKGVKLHGQFETLICKGCGYTEWYAKDIGFLRDDPVNGVQLIVNDVEKEGPYR